jgi:hypothetical protein
MTEDGRELVLRQHREEIERLRNLPSAPRTECPEQSKLELPEVEPGSAVAAEWAIFQREVERLLQEGQQGRFAIIKGDQPITVWDTLRDAVQAAHLLYGHEPCLVQQVLPYLPSLRVG